MPWNDSRTPICGRRWKRIWFRGAARAAPAWFRNEWTIVSRPVGEEPVADLVEAEKLAEVGEELEQSDQVKGAEEDTDDEIESEETGAEEATESTSTLLVHAVTRVGRRVRTSTKLLKAYQEFGLSAF